MNQKTNSKAILLDADVLIHFSKGDSILRLKKIYPKHEKWLFDAVKNEVRFGKTRAEIDFAIMEGFLKIVYLTTMDLLCEALRSGEMTEEDCDKFIEKVLAQDSRLPCQFISQYSERRFL